MNILKPSVYFVDDDATLLDGLRRNLISKKNEWDMSFYSDPTEAMIAFEEMPADIVVSDLEMPELSGLDMVAQMLNAKALSSTKFIILSGSGNFASALSAINDLSVYRFLQKPISREGLVEAIDGALEELHLSRPSIGQHAETALGLINAAILVVSREGQLLYSNESGQLLTQSNGHLSIGNDKICRASNSEDTRALREIIAEACDDTDDCVRWLCLENSQTGEPHNLIVIPQGDMGQARSVVLLSTDGQLSSDLNAEILQGMFGLTPAEASITLAITRGEKLEDAAKSSGITVSSARTYLKRVFSKTGASRQADLVQLVLTSPAALIKKKAS